MFEQNEYDEIYLRQAAEYDANMRLERLRNWFQIVSALAGIVVAVFILTHKKFQ
jgi:hypothetical protein